MSVVFCKIMIQEGAKLGRHLWLSPKGNIILGVESIGENSMIHHNVTFGMNIGNKQDPTGKPALGDRIWVGPDTIVHGGITVGSGTTILEGSVLSKSVPACSVVKGNPARVILRDVDNSCLFTSMDYRNSEKRLNGKGSLND